jgi:pyruvate formate lyase activating enzyme
MRFGGLQKFTLSDYPGKIAAILFTQGCNFACPFCHNGSLIPMRCSDSSQEVSESEIIKFLRSRIGKLQGVVITGGEPTIHRDLPQFIHLLKRMDYTVKLDTNGSNPEMIEKLLNQDLVDFFAMDIKADWPDYTRLAGKEVNTDRLKKTVELIANSGVDHIFRTTIVPALHGSRAETKIRELVPQGSKYVVQQFNPANALDPVTCQQGDTQVAVH